MPNIEAISVAEAGRRLRLGNDPFGAERVMDAICDMMLQASMKILPHLACFDDMEGPVPDCFPISGLVYLRIPSGVPMVGEALSKVVEVHASSDTLCSTPGVDLSRAQLGSEHHLRIRGGLSVDPSVLFVTRDELIRYAAIKGLTFTDEPVLREPEAATETAEPLGTRERTNLLRLVGALLSMYLTEQQQHRVGKKLGTLEQPNLSAIAKRLLDHANNEGKSVTGLKERTVAERLKDALDTYRSSDR